MGRKRLVAPDTSVRSFPTPNIDDLVIFVDVDSRLPGYKPQEYGSLHPDQNTFPGAKLVFQEPIEGSDQFVRRIYATDRVNQDSYNYAIKYSGGSTDHPIYIRNYLESRADYKPSNPGTVDPLNPSAFVVEEEAKPVEGELSSLYFNVTRVFETLPGPVITSFDTNEAGQKVTITTQRKPKAGYVMPNASATTSVAAQSEDVDVVTEQISSVPEIFSRKQFSADRPDMLPQKFRAAVPDVETSEIVEGIAEQPELGQGDISASETQQTTFVKQVSRRSRNAPEYPVTITETTVTRAGQLATVTSTLEDNPQTADTGPLVESSEVTDLGDGRTIKVTTEVDQVFQQPSFTRTRDDVTPVKFKAALTEIVEERTDTGTAAMPPSLTNEQLSVTEEQITVDKKRRRVASRSVPGSTTLGNGRIYTKELGGGIATVTEKYGTNPSITPGYGTVESQKEELGDGNFVAREIVLPSPPTLVGQEYDEQLDVVFPFTQKVVPASSSLGDNRSVVSPQDVYHSVKREFDIEAFRQKAFQEMWTVPAYIEVDLPDVLESVEILYAKSTSKGTATGTGASYSIQASASTTVAGDARVNIRNGYRGPVPATRYVFFLDKDSAGISTILSKTNSQNWPAVFTRPEVITIAGGSVTQQLGYSFSQGTDDTLGSSSNTTNFSGDARVGVVTIQPTLHSGIGISTREVTISSPSATGGILNPQIPTLTPQFTPTNIPPTTPTRFPTGNFLVSVNTESYKYGLVRVSATVVHITNAYV